MNTDSIKTSSIRIPNDLKKGIQIIAKNNKTSQSKIIASALENFILENKKTSIKLKLQKILSQNIDEEWTAEDELDSINHSRRNKVI